MSGEIRGDFGVAEGSIQQITDRNKTFMFSNRYFSLLQRSFQFQLSVQFRGCHLKCVNKIHRDGSGALLVCVSVWWSLSQAAGYDRSYFQLNYLHASFSTKLNETQMFTVHTMLMYSANSVTPPKKKYHYGDITSQTVHLWFRMFELVKSFSVFFCLVDLFVFLSLSISSICSLLLMINGSVQSHLCCISHFLFQPRLWHTLHSISNQSPQQLS